MDVREQFLWVEKYRPRTIADCVLPDSLKDNFQEFLDRKEVPTLLLTGTAGVGKTTVARALCEQLGCDYIVINGSEESGIDVLRNKIRNFASTVSLEGGAKMVILDEADYLNPNSTQPALRGFIEEFANNCRFIFTCNFENRIIEPLRSRCSVIRFTLSNDDKPKMAAKFLKRIETILTTEKVTYDKDAVARLLMKHFPDYRRVLNELQRYSVSGTIDAGVLVNIAEVNISQLTKTLKDKDWTAMRKWVGANSDNDFNQLIRKLFDTASVYLEPQSVPQLVLILGDYQYKMAFVADQELNVVAMLTEVMTSCQFKG